MSARVWFCILSLPLVACAANSSSGGTDDPSHDGDSGIASPNDVGAPLEAGSDAPTPPHDATPHDGSPSDAGDDASAPAPSTAIQGVYVPTFGKPYNASDGTVATMLDTDGVDGIFIFESWMHLQPTKDTYDWSDLDAWIDAAIAKGKKASIGVMAGSATPSWVGTDSDFVTFTVWASQQKKCLSDERIPIPWHTAYQDAWKGFVEAFAAHLKATPARWDAVTQIKLTGLNGTTAETGLPGVATSTHGTCVTTDAPTAWHAVGYTNDLAISTWKTIASFFDAPFAGKALCMQYVDKGFPAEVDASGKVLPHDDTVSKTIVQDGLDMFGVDRWIVEGTGLSAVGGTVPVLDDYAANPGAVVGYQTLYYVAGDTNCVMNPGGTCDAKALHAAIDIGVAAPHLSRYLELYVQDVAAYPAEILYAHGLLTTAHATIHP